MSAPLRNVKAKWAHFADLERNSPKWTIRRITSSWYRMEFPGNRRLVPTDLRLYAMRHSAVKTLAEANCWIRSISFNAFITRQTMTSGGIKAHHIRYSDLDGFRMYLCFLVCVCVCVRARARMCVNLQNQVIRISPKYLGNICITQLRFSGNIHITWKYLYSMCEHLCVHVAESFLYAFVYLHSQFVIHLLYIYMCVCVCVSMYVCVYVRVVI